MELSIFSGESRILQIALPIVGASFFILAVVWMMTPVRSVRIWLKRDPYPSVDFSDRYSFMLSVSKLLGEVLERWVQMKRSPFGYWNNVSANLRFFGAVVISAMLTYAIDRCFLKASNSPADRWFILTCFGATFATLYFQERSAYYEKWSYLANLYNQVLATKPFVLGGKARVEDIYSCRDSLRFALAQDILQMEMWSHPSFYYIFEMCLVEAIRKVHGKEDLSEEEVIDIACGMRKDAARKLLGELQDMALKREKKSYMSRVYRVR